jgi:hypothetical protein
MKKLIIFSFLILTTFVNASDDRIVFRYEVHGSGEALHTLSIEGWDANLKKECNQDEAAGLFACKGIVKAVILTPHGFVYMRGGKSSDQVTVTIDQYCGKKQGQAVWKPVVGLPKRPLNTDHVGDLFFDKLDILLNPCHRNLP